MHAVLADSWLAKIRLANVCRWPRFLPRAGCGLLLVLAADVSHAAVATPLPDARTLLTAMIDLTRGLTSYTEMTMQVHRPEWEKSSSLVAWTRGREDALIRFVAPAKDAGNATLKLGRDMWTYAPKVNRVIRLPASLMSQSWAGSDFSYDDLSRSDELLVHYDLRITATHTEGSHRVYDIDATPLTDAPVVWGMQRLRVRDDAILVEETFFDQDMKPLKRLSAVDINRLGGRMMATRLRMSDLREPNHYTEMTYRAARFDIPVDAQRFTQFALRNQQ